MSDVDIRPAGCDDFDGIMSLEAECFDEIERWRESAWRAELGDVGRLVLVGQVHDVTVPGTLVAAACFHLAGDTAELYRVMTAQQWRGLGVATLLLARGFAWARRGGASEMLLEVRMDNRARSLYADAGFTPLYERTNYYGPGLHALVMRRSLEGEEHE